MCGFYKKKYRKNNHVKIVSLFCPTTQLTDYLIAELLFFCEAKNTIIIQQSYNEYNSTIITINLKENRT